MKDNVRLVDYTKITYLSEINYKVFRKQNGAVVSYWYFEYAIGNSTHRHMVDSHPSNSDSGKVEIEKTHSEISSVMLKNPSVKSIAVNI